MAFGTGTGSSCGLFQGLPRIHVGDEKNHKKASRAVDVQAEI